MSGGKKLVVALSVLVTGVSAALFFRKDASLFDFRQEATPENPFKSRVERRAVADTAWIRNLSRPRHKSPDTAQRVAPAVASIPSSTPPAGGPTYQKSFSPVGALLEPLDGIPPGQSDNDAALDVLPATAPGALASQEPQTHRIVDGDTLSKLAGEYLGRADRYLEIYELNRDVLANPDLLPIGSLLKIPPRQTEPAPPRGPQPGDRSNDSPLHLVPVPAGAHKPLG
jgi:LysM repeat protein